MTIPPKPPEKEKPLRSPCVSLCALDINDICMGCQRSGKEISYWGRMTNEERRQVLDKAHTRAREQGLLS